MKEIKILVDDEEYDFIQKAKSKVPKEWGDFDENIDFGIVDEIAKTEPLKVVFRDSCFKTENSPKTY